MWLPHTTVAAIVEKDEKFLMVYENSDGQKVYNQPAGHLDEHETLLQACVRETLEETGWHVKPIGFLGISLYRSPLNDITYIRHTFIAEPIEPQKDAELDIDIIEARWMSYNEIVQNKSLLRSPVVLNDLKRYQAGINIPLETISAF